MVAKILERSTPLERQGRVRINGAAEILGVTPRTLYAWRAADHGPKSVRYAGKLWYRSEDCYRFMAEAEAATAKGAGL